MQGVELLSLARCAAILGVSDRTMRVMIERNQLPSVPVGNRRRVCAEVLKLFSRGELNHNTKG